MTEAGGDSGSTEDGRQSAVTSRVKMRGNDDGEYRITQVLSELRTKWRENEG